MAIDRTGISSLQSGAGEITYSGNEGPKSPDQMLMASADPMLVDEYKKYVFQMEEQGMQPISFREFVEQIMSESRQGGAYGGTAHPTYTQSRRQRINAAGGGIMGSNAGSMLVAPTADGSRPGYGWLSDIKDKFVDDIIPNEIKENPMLSAAVLGGAANYMDLIPGQMSSQGWIGNLLGGAGDMLGTGARKAGTALGIPGADDWFTGGISGMDDAGLPADWKGLLAKQVMGGGLGDVKGTALDYAKNLILGDQYGGSLTGGIADQFQKFIGGQQGTGTGTGQDIRWKTPLAIGTAMGAAQAAMPKDVLPQDTSGIDMASAIRGDDLRFKPDASVLKAQGGIAQLAQGGRIGYERGRVVRPGGYAGVIDRNIANLQTKKELFPDDWTVEDEAELQRQLGVKGGARDKLLSGDPVPEETVPEEEGSFWDFLPFVGKAQGGRIGYNKGGNYSQNAVANQIHGTSYGVLNPFEQQQIDSLISQVGTTSLGTLKKAQGGRIGAQEGGLMDLGGMEKDYRQEGGFVPIGGQERADDVPARLSKNEFVFTADAVRSAGGGDIDAGAEVMENVMNNLEQGGQISEESQGLEGARNMFATAQRLEGVM